MSNDRLDFYISSNVPNPNLYKEMTFGLAFPIESNCPKKELYLNGSRIYNLRQELTNW